MTNKRAGIIGDLILFVIVVFILLALAIHIGGKGDRKFCTDNNYSTQNEYMVYEKDNIEEGYISCCNDIIINHTIQGQKCDVLKYPLD